MKEEIKDTNDLPGEKKYLEERKTAPILPQKLFLEHKIKDTTVEEAKSAIHQIDEEEKEPPAKKEKFLQNPDIITAQERKPKLEEEPPVSNTKKRDEWEIYQKSAFSILDWDSENRPKLVACKEIYLMLGKKIFHRVDILSSHNFVIFQFFTEEEKALEKILKTFEEKPIHIDKLLQYYENRVPQQWKIFHLLYKDDCDTRDRIARLLNFLQKTVLPTIKKQCLEFHKYFLDQKKIFELLEMQSKKREDEARTILKVLLTEFDKGQSKPDLRAQATIEMWNLERAYISFIQMYKSGIEKVFEATVLLWKKAYSNNIERLKKQNELFNNYFLQKTNSIGGLANAENELMKANAEEINDCIFGYKKMINTEELEMIACYDTANDQKPYFRREDIEKLFYDDFIKFLSHLLLSIPDTPAILIEKKRGTFLREVDTLSKKWQPCFVCLSSDDVLHVYEKKEDILPEISLQLRRANLQIKEINHNKVLIIEEEIIGILPFKKVLKLRIDNSDEYSLWIKLFCQVIPHQ